MNETGDRIDVILKNTSKMKALQSNKDEPAMEKQSSTFKCICLCSAFFGLGLCLSLPGVTLPDLASLTEAPESHMTLIFTGRGAGYLIGSLSSGFLLDRVKEGPVLTFFLLVTAVVTMAIPWRMYLVFMVLLFTLQGVALGFLRTGGNHLCVNIWGQHSLPYMQIIHFFLGLGAFVAPFLVEPFLEHNRFPTVNPTYSQTNITEHNMTVITADTVGQHLNHVQYSYLIVGLLLLKASFLFCCFNNENDSTCRLENPPDIITSDSFPNRITFLLFWFYFAAIGIQYTYGALCVIFAIDYFNFAESKAAYVAAVFWGSFALFQLSAIFTSVYVKPSSLLFVSLMMSCFSSVILCTLGVARAEPVFWIGTSLLGMGLATIFPTGIVWIERFIKITAKTASVFVIGAALGEMLMPLIVGSFMSFNPMSLIYIIFVALILEGSTFVILHLLTSRTGDRYYSPLVSREDMDEEIVYDHSWLTTQGGKLKPKFTQERLQKEAAKHD